MTAPMHVYIEPELHVQWVSGILVITIKDGERMPAVELDLLQPRAEALVAAIRCAIHDGAEE